MEVKNRRTVQSSDYHGDSVPRLPCPYHKHRRSSRREEVDIMVALFFLLFLGSNMQGPVDRPVLYLFRFESPNYLQFQGLPVVFFTGTMRAS